MLKTLKKIVSLTLIASMVACSSTPLSPESAFKQHASNPAAMDKITHFMLSQDGKTLIMLGNKHHYSFQVGEDVGAILNWTSKEKLRASLYGAHSADGKNISLNYKLDVPETQVTPEEIAFLKAHHFQHYPNYKTYLHYGQLSGQYYQANDVDLSKFDRFKKEYTLTYKAQDLQTARYRSTAENTGNTLLFLGVLIIIVPLALLFSPVNLFKSNKYSH